jgi:hypothetical protein
MNREHRLNSPRGKAVWGSTRIRRAVALRAVALTAVLLVPSCGQAVRTGQGSSYLILTTLADATGSNVVLSDVLNVDPTTGVKSVKNDPGTATFLLAMKDPTSGLTPSDVNSITLTQYHVQYVRSDGHNVEGVDVPYAFDGAVTVTVSGTSSVGFMLVRDQAKLEAPLAAMASGNQVMTAIAHITFYGHDQAGRDASVTGDIEITFANFPG